MAGGAVWVRLLRGSGADLSVSHRDHKPGRADTVPVVMDARLEVDKVGGGSNTSTYCALCTYIRAARARARARVRVGRCESDAIGTVG